MGFILSIAVGVTLSVAAVTVWFDAAEAPASLFVAVTSLIATGGGVLLGVFGQRP